MIIITHNGKRIEAYTRYLGSDIKKYASIVDTEGKRSSYMEYSHFGLQKDSARKRAYRVAVAVAKTIAKREGGIKEILKSP